MEDINRHLNIMLVEDNDDHADYIISGLEGEYKGITIIRYPDAESALEYLDSLHDHCDLLRRPNIILLDIQLPGMDGIEMLGQLRNMKNMSALPVVMLSTSSRRDEIKLCYKYGARGYIVKPVDYDMFIRKMKQFRDYWTETSELPEMAV